MEYNNPSELVKDLSFGSDAKSKIMAIDFWPKILPFRTNHL